MKKIMLVFGTRPEAIKMCPLINELKKRTNINTRLEITELLLSAPKYRGVQIKQTTIPISGSYGGMRGLGGRSLFSVDFDTNAKELREFIYGVTTE